MVLKYRTMDSIEYNLILKRNKNYIIVDESQKFKPNDIVLIQEYDNKQYTGEMCFRKISHEHSSRLDLHKLMLIVHTPDSLSPKTSTEMIVHMLYCNGYDQEVDPENCITLTLHYLSRPSQIWTLDLSVPQEQAIWINQCIC